MQKIFLLVFFSLLVFSPFAFAQSDAIGVRIETDNAFLESELELRIIASSRSPVNAFDIVLEYPQEYFEFVRASTARSVVSVWQSLPLKAKDGAVQLTGGMIEPFLGEGEIITLVFRAKKPGDATFLMKKTDFALADGRGTVISPPEARHLVSIAESENRAESEFTPSAPRISEIAITQDPLEKATIAVVKTEDDGAVEEVYVRSREWILWSDWQRAQLLSAVPKGAWAIQAAIISWDGGESSATIYRWKVVALKILIIAVFAAVAWYGGRRVVKIWKSKKQKI